MDQSKTKIEDCAPYPTNPSTTNSRKPRDRVKPRTNEEGEPPEARKEQTSAKGNPRETRVLPHHQAWVQPPRAKENRKKKTGVEEEKKPKPRARRPGSGKGAKDPSWKRDRRVGTRKMPEDLLVHIRKGRGRSSRRSPEAGGPHPRQGPQGRMSISQKRTRRR
jgi:hypothetical protein